MGKPLAKCETKHFYKVLMKNPLKAQREKLAELCTFWASHVGWDFKPSNMAKLKHKGSKLPLLHQEQWVHTKVLHKAHMVGAHQHGPNAQQECIVCQELDTHEHAFLHCTMAASVWQGLLEWTAPMWRAEKLTTPAPSVALCMLGLLQANTPMRWLDGSLQKLMHWATNQSQMPCTLGNTTNIKSLQTLITN